MVAVESVIKENHGLVRILEASIWTAQAKASGINNK